MTKDEPLYTKQLQNLTDEQYAEVQKKLDTEHLLKFADEYTPVNFLSLIFNFFYKKCPTWWYNINILTSRGNYQTSSGRARSVVDFYLIQKYYLNKPLNFKECADIYFLILPRFIWTKGYTDNVKSGNYKSYTAWTTGYCSTVRRNVFSASQISNIKAITDNIDLQVACGISPYTLPKKGIKKEFIELGKKGEIILKKLAEEAEKARLIAMEKAKANHLERIKTIPNMVVVCTSTADPDFIVGEKYLLHETHAQNRLMHNSGKLYVHYINKSTSFITYKGIMYGMDEQRKYYNVPESKYLTRFRYLTTDEKNI